VVDGDGAGDPAELGYRHESLEACPHPRCLAGAGGEEGQGAKRLCWALGSALPLRKSSGKSLAMRTKETIYGAMSL